MGKYREKSAVIEAVQWTGKNGGEITEFIGRLPAAMGKLPPDINNVVVWSMIAELNDWIIKGIKGECYPCKPDIFAETYEKVEVVEDE